MTHLTNSVGAGALSSPLPYMSENEIAMFSDYLHRSSRVSEFGAGRSTAFAIRAGVNRLVSVESDAGWLSRVREDSAVQSALIDNRLHLVHADIGPVGKWGFPNDRTEISKWHSYPEAPWPVWEQLGEHPDLVLVDGRFRVACCLRSLLWRGEQMRDSAFHVLLHDVSDKRPGYAVVFDWMDLVDRVDSLCAFAPKASIDITYLERAYAKAVLIPL